MTTIIIETAKGLLILASVLAGLWLFSYALVITYGIMGDNIGYLALIPTSLVLSYFIGHAINAQKEFPQYSKQ